MTLGHAPLTIEQRSLIVWLSCFFVYELCAHWRAPKPVVAALLVALVLLTVYLWPIVTLSRTIWGGIHWWHPLADAVIVFTVILDVHFVWMLSAGYLVAAGLVIAGGIFDHWYSHR